QVKLLRAIQEKSIRPVGAEDEIPVDVRILSASHKNLAKEVQSNQFRQDLFYRINVIELMVPSLRERKDDIPQLAETFLERFANESGLPVPTLSNEALQTLLGYSFPGNIRELENTLERAFTLCHGSTIDSEDLQLQTEIPSIEQLHQDTESLTQTKGEFDSIDDYLATVEKGMLIRVLERNRWNKTASAKELGISFRQMRHKLKKFEIE
ncbi:MAG: sigma 54-interacting transcriptional regulator, partial [Porticoccus sp.]